MPFPLIGEVQAAGLTPTELEARMRELLAKEIAGARTIVPRESKEAIRLAARALPAVAQLVGMPVTDSPRATTRPRGCGSRPRESPEPRPSLRNPG